MSKTYFIPLNEVRREHTVINSRFIATLVPVFTVERGQASPCWLSYAVAGLGTWQW